MTEIKGDRTKGISFASDCFVLDGYRTEWTTGYTQGKVGYAPSFTSHDAAIAYARKVGRPLTEKQVPVYRRIRWQ